LLLWSLGLRGEVKRFVLLGLWVEAWLFHLDVFDDDEYEHDYDSYFDEQDFFFDFGICFLVQLIWFFAFFPSAITYPSAMGFWNHTADT